jgi:glycosyltransferase involved in cell wall biosynthesis
MKKICYCTTIAGTLESFVVESAKYLHEHTDWDISFICDYNEEFAKSLPEYIHYYPVKMERGISIGGFKAIKEFKKIFKREKFDLVQYSTPNASLYASIAAKQVKIPVRLYCQWGIVYAGYSGIKRKILKAEEKFVCKRSTAIKPDSKSNLEFAIAEKLYPEEKGSVVWNGSASGVNLEKFDISKKEAYRKEIRKELNIDSNTFVFGFVGRVTRDKGINELLEAFKRLLNDIEDIRLVLVGSNEYNESNTNEIYEWAQLNNKIDFIGPSYCVEKYLSAMDCYVLPSYREGFGIGVIEAEAMGLPVIVSDIPGPTDAMIRNETGIVVKKQDVDTLVEAMKNLYYDRDLCSEYGEKGLEFVRDSFEQKALFEYILEDRKILLNE